jgi:hypothetical protein
MTNRSPKSCEKSSESRKNENRGSGVGPPSRHHRIADIRRLERPSSNHRIVEPPSSDCRHTRLERPNSNHRIDEPPSSNCRHTKARTSKAKPSDRQRATIGGPRVIHSDHRHQTIGGPTAKARSIEAEMSGFRPVRIEPPRGAKSTRRRQRLGPPRGAVSDVEGHSLECPIQIRRTIEPLHSDGRAQSFGPPISANRAAEPNHSDPRWPMHRASDPPPSDRRCSRFGNPRVGTSKCRFRGVGSRIE